MEDLLPFEWEAELGRQVREIRLRKDINQQRLSEQADVALNVVKRLESGKAVTVLSLIKVLRALDRVDWIRTLAPAVSVRPMQVLRAKSGRQRASRANSIHQHV